VSIYDQTGSWPAGDFARCTYCSVQRSTEGYRAIPAALLPNLPLHVSTGTRSQAVHGTVYTTYVGIVPYGSVWCGTTQTQEAETGNGWYRQRWQGCRHVAGSLVRYAAVRAHTTQYGEVSFKLKKQRPVIAGTDKTDVIRTALSEPVPLSTARYHSNSRNRDRWWLIPA
jgi:hypothetical protein